MAIGTMALAMPIYLVFERFEKITGGSDGTVVPPTIFFGSTMGNLFYYYSILVFTALVFLIAYFLADSRIGRAFKAVRDNQDAAEAIGVDANHYRRLAWLVNVLLAGIAGGLYAQQAAYISPVTFSLGSNILMLVMLCVGGQGTILGPVVGAAIMTSIPRLRAVCPYWRAFSGVRWAEMTETSKSMPSSFNASRAGCTASASDFEPMTTPTNGIFSTSPPVFPSP